MKIKSILIALIIGVDLLGACTTPIPSTMSQETSAPPAQTLVAAATSTPSQSPKKTTSTPTTQPTQPTKPTQPSPSTSPASQTVTPTSQSTKPSGWTEAERIEPDVSFSVWFPG